MDLREHSGRNTKCILPELPSKTLMVVISWVSNGKHNLISPKQLQASYTDMRHWEELIDFIFKNGGQKEPYSPKLLFKYTLE